MNLTEANDFIEENNLGFFDAVTLMYMNEDDLELLVNLLEQNDEEVLFIFWEDCESDFSVFEDRFKGVYESYEEFGREYSRDFEVIPSFIENHVDYESYGEELAQDFADFDMSDGKFVLFWN